VCGHRREVVGVVIHVMAAAGLRGAAMAAPVMGYDAIAVLEEEQHLRVPVIGRQRPAVAKHNGLTFAPVFIVNLRAVFGRNRAHSLENGTVFICMDLRKRPSQKFGRLLDQPWGIGPKLSRVPLFPTMFKPINSERSAKLSSQPGLEHWFKERRTIVDFRRGPHKIGCVSPPARSTKRIVNG
jgi:hypothetical protein